MANLVRRDANHRDIRDALVTAGRPVLDVAHHHGLGFDLLVQHRDGGLVAMEIKVSKRATLTESESNAALLFGADFVVVTTVDEALAAAGLIRKEAA